MSKLKKLITEIHHRSLWQVLLIYVGGALIGYQAVQALVEGLGLPPWFPAFAVVLFIVGLPIVVATAFVHEVAPPAAAPSEAEPDIVEAEVVAARHAARRRHRFMTWRNAVASFVVALAVWGIVATGWMLFSGGEAETRAVADERPSVAALPFANRSGLEEDEYFTDGIHDEILTLLSKISNLSVRGRTSVMQYRDTEKNLRQIGEELNARYILEGGVQRAGGTVRINLQLLDTERDEHVWAETYDRPLTVENLLGVQSEVALRVAEALKATLTADEANRIEQRPTDNLEAYEYYLRGMSYMRKGFDEVNLRAAVQMFEKAVELDPQFALALANLSWAHADTYWWYYDRTEERLAMAREAAESALQIDPRLPAGQRAMGRYYITLWQYDRALDVLLTALESDPNNGNIHARLADLARRGGDWDLSESRLRTALELDPRDPRKYYSIGATLFFKREFEAALQFCDQGLSLAEDQSLSRILKVRLLVGWNGDVEGALQVLRESPREITPGELLGGNINGSRWLFRILLGSSPAMSVLSPDSFGADTAQYFLARAELNQLQGDGRDARANYDSARAHLEKAVVSTPNQPHVHSRLGIAYAGLGRSQEAIREGKIAAALVPLSKDAMDGTDWVAYLAETYVMVGECSPSAGLRQFQAGD